MNVVCCYVREELHLKLIIKDSALFESIRCLLIAFSFLKKGWLVWTMGNEKIQNTNCSPLTYWLP